MWVSFLSFFFLFFFFFLVFFFGVGFFIFENFPFFLNFLFLISMFESNLNRNKLVEGSLAIIFFLFLLEMVSILYLYRL